MITDPGEQTTIFGGPGDDTIRIDATMGDGASPMAAMGLTHT